MQLTLLTSLVLLGLAHALPQGSLITDNMRIGSCVEFGVVCAVSGTRFCDGQTGEKSICRINHGDRCSIEITDSLCTQNTLGCDKRGDCKRGFFEGKIDHHHYEHNRERKNSDVDEEREKTKGEEKKKHDDQEKEDDKVEGQRHGFDYCTAFGDHCKIDNTRYCDSARGKTNVCHHIPWGGRCAIEFSELPCV